VTARILVAFATRNGSTAEIAYAIGKDLQSAGATVTIADMKTVLSLEGYTAVVIGAPLYMGHLPGEVQNFVKQFNENLAKLPVAAFAVGFAPLSKEAGAVEEAMEILKNSLAPLNPVASTLFAGKLDEKKLNLVTRKFLEMAKIPAGDFRDWGVIATWARELPGRLGV
jgi:menaquinone-dependent protoporphyrinogen oxidase